VQAEEEKLAMEAQLRQAQKLESIGTMASGVAHEINNPLTGMINYAQLITERVEDDDLKRFAQGIMKEGNRVAEIIKDLLYFARQEKQSHSPARMEDIIDSSLTLVGATMRKYQIAIEKDIQSDLPQVRCRSQQIEQVVINLLTNARDALNQRYEGYHEDKLIKLTVRTLEKDGVEWIRTTVEDHGVGIPKDVIDRIFDPFFTTKPRDVGTGLGLSVSYGIIKEHHGELTVESKPGKYTRFHLDLRVDNGWSLG
jgi:signal transduction histidine kinase